MRIAKEPTQYRRSARSSNNVSRNLDEIDRKILSEIQADGRITNVELAKRVGISPPACLRRVRTLEEEGYIQGYRGLLDPRRPGFDLTVYASVHLCDPGDHRAAPVGDVGARGAVGAGMLDVVGRSRLHPEMRGA